MHEHVMHVRLKSENGTIVVTNSIARWYADELAKAGIRL
jgi:hypothetical protein